MKDFITLTKESFGVYKQKIMPILILMLILLGVAVLFAILSPFIALGGVMMENSGYFTFLLILGISLVMTFLSAFVGLSLALLVIKPAGTELKKIFQEAWEKLWQYFLVSVLVGFFVAIAFLFLVIPGIIVAVYLTFSSFVFIIEAEKGMKALKRSWNLVKGNWWEVFGRLFFLNVVFGIGFILLGSISDLLGSLFQILFIPFMMIFSYLIYLELKKSKEVQIQAQE